jgi:hypothetical protein
MFALNSELMKGWPKDACRNDYRITLWILRAECALRMTAVWKFLSEMRKPAIYGGLLFSSFYFSNFCEITCQSYGLVK